MSISSVLAKILKQAGVNPNLYDTGRTGIHKADPEDEDDKIPFNPPDDFDKELPKRTRSSEFVPPPPKIKKDDKKDDRNDGKKRIDPLDIGPLQEYHDPKSRTRAVVEHNEDKGLKLIYQWAKSGQIEFEEFEDLLAEIVRKIRPKL